MINEPVDADANPSPFKGLTHYTEEDAPFFFGRTVERDLIIANLKARRLTLLYGGSGVGKSSVLRAGVASHLMDAARLDAQQIRGPEFVPVVFSDWTNDPVRRLSIAIRSAIREFLPDPGVLPRGQGLADLIQTGTRLTGARMLVMLDQFEEYFLYSRDETEQGSFAAEFVSAVNRPGLSAGFLLAIREDALAKLDLFEEEIPKLFENYIRLGHLDLEAARQAIEGPLEEYSQREAGGEPVKADPELVDAVLDQVRAGKVALEHIGRGLPTEESDQGDEDAIETPYLQLVMTRLWGREISAGSRVLRLATLADLGGAQAIIRTHLDTALAGLDAQERDEASGLFHYLVTPSGTKIALTAADLAAYTRISQPRVDVLLKSLGAPDVRVIREIPSPASHTGEPALRSSTMRSPIRF